MVWNLSDIGTDMFVAAHARWDVRTFHKRKKNLPGMGARRLGNELIGFGEPTSALSGNWDEPNIRDCTNITTDAQVNVSTCPQYKTARCTQYWRHKFMRRQRGQASTRKKSLTIQLVVSTGSRSKVSFAEV